MPSDASKYFVEGRKAELQEEAAEISGKRFQYLIGLTDLFRHFIDARAEKDPRFAELVASVAPQKKESKATGSKGGSHRGRKTEKQEDSELLQSDGSEDLTVFTESPGFIHGKLRDYQIAGLNWMVSLHENNINGILADEMGLGKTLQTISFLGYLRWVKEITGPHLILVPKSTLDNWRREFQQWTPEVRTVVLQGTKEERSDLIKDKLLTCDFDVCIASYETVLREKNTFRKFAWQYIIVDEAHRIKNEESQLSQIIRILSSRNRLLITGTPLQNNMHELWALLNFLLPDIFGDAAVFDQWFEKEGDQDAVIRQLHKVLRPFLLRRLKSEVEHSLLPKREVNLYIGMSPMQRKWYQQILERDIAAVNGVVGAREKSRLQNIVMQLRKCCNHPYLFEGAEPGPPFTTDEHLVENSGKLRVLDKLLQRLKAKGSRVLIFSQMSRLLDILEDYCWFRGYKYCRIDGQTDHEVRINAIDEYNKPGSDKFIFLLTTRAGGLGINLTTADSVVLFDSDWNPQADLQAMDRAHRIGQTKQVHVYRFVTEKSIEEKVVERAAKKLKLDQLVIQQGRASAEDKKQSAKNAKDELLGMIQHGAQAVFDEKPDTNDEDETDDIDKLLEAGEKRTEELSHRYEGLGIDELQKFEQATEKPIKKSLQVPAIVPTLGKRGRPVQDGFYRPAHLDRERRVRGPKQIHLQDHQFWPQRLYDLQLQELSWHRNQIGDEPEDALDKWEISHAKPLTDEEKEELKGLRRVGFSNWTRRDFTTFIGLMAQYGRDNFEEIIKGLPEKSELEIRTYHEAFWRRYREIELYERYLSLIEQGQEKAERQRLQTECLKKKVESCDAPLQQLVIDAPQTGRKLYSEIEDRFLVLQLYQLGLDAPNLYEQIREAIRESPLFRFDWFFLSRMPVELGRRCQSLLAAIAKESSK